MRYRATKMPNKTLTLGPISPFRPYNMQLIPATSPAISLRGQPTADIHVAEGRVEMVYRIHEPVYSRLLIALFTFAGIVTILSILGLFIAPLYATKIDVVILYFVLALGLGLLAITVKRAQTVRERRK